MRHFNRLAVLGAALMLPATAFAQEHAAGPVNLLAPSAGVMFWTLIIFGTFAFIVWKAFYPSIIENMKSRENALRDALDSAKRDRDEAARVLADHTAKLEAARGEAQKMLADGRAAAERMKEQAVADTKKQQDELLARAKRDIETEKAKAISDLRAEAVDLALRGASKVIERNLDDAANRKLVEDFLGSVGKR
ncbi:MAG TPA: F0F1 ATP synthase subunit B [Gemmatimonadaceae bacterium]|nr:F0F1 ATP synthase subunit B [Gemmatimonadaceae bacterium]